jgi:uncharacterized protein YdhG (YjbR/CyaY superfamily)
MDNAVDKYLSSFPEDVRERLDKMRDIIRKIVPDAEEKIGYGIPTYKLNGKNFVHFGGFKNHIGFYPAPSGLAAFEKELSPYKAAKGSVQFPHDKPFPTALITKIVKYRLKQEKEKAAPKKK